MQRSPFTHCTDAPVIEMQRLEGHALPVAAKVRELLWGDEAVLVEMIAPAVYARQ